MVAWSILYLSSKLARQVSILASNSYTVANPDFGLQRIVSLYSVCRKNNIESLVMPEGRSIFAFLE